MLLGQLGYKPWDLHRITWREVVLSLDGLERKNEYTHDLLYRATMIITHSGMNAKAALTFMRKAWPLTGDKATKVSDRVRETLKRFQELDAKNNAKKKLDGRVKANSRG